jgi:hypothetical protein
MSEITMNAATPIKPESYENLFILLSDKRMNKKSIAKILRDDPKFAEWFEAKK